MLLASLLLACSDPEASAAADYIHATQPLMVENGFLSERVLALAVPVQADNLPASGLAPTWNSEIVPLAEHLHNQAGVVEVPEGWEIEHNDLVAIWGDRASAYRSLGEAVVLADRERWNSARELQGKVVKREEAWFQRISDTLATHELKIQQFP